MFSEMNFSGRVLKWSVALLLIIFYALTAPQNHAEAEDAYDYALKVEQGAFADQTGVNRVLALPMFGMVYDDATALGYSGRAFGFMVFLNRLLAVGCIFLFWKLVGGTRSVASIGRHSVRPSSDNDKYPTRNPSESDRSSTISHQLVPVLGLAFSYGFWRYANEAETYMLAMFAMLGAWVLAVKGRWIWCVFVSALGVLIHLLNVVPLLLIIPLYYLLSRNVKRAVVHGFLTSLFICMGYAACSPWLDFSELGAQHHSIEAGFSGGNMVRAIAAFGQNVVSGNFLFGFGRIRELLTGLFPSRVLVEEFYMAKHMPVWIPWVGLATLSLLVVCSLWFVVLLCKTGWKSVCSCFTLQAYNFQPLTLSALVWLLLYAVAVLRTEAGSPELWIMALVPFCLLAHGAWSMGHGVGGKPSAVSWLLLASLFTHNLVAGLLPVMPEESDYHAAKGQWLEEHAQPSDLILTSYEPVMIFYLDYFALGEVVNSGSHPEKDIERLIDGTSGTVYALDSFFHPLEPMRIRSPELYEKMRGIGLDFAPRFEKVHDDEFGGIYRLIDDGREHG